MGMNAHPTKLYVDYLNKGLELDNEKVINCFGAAIFCFDRLQR